MTPFGACTPGPAATDAELNRRALAMSCNAFTRSRIDRLLDLERMNAGNWPFFPKQSLCLLRLANPFILDGSHGVI